MPSIVDFSHFQKAVHQDYVRTAGHCARVFLVPEQLPPAYSEGLHALQLHAGLVHNINIALLCPGHHMTSMQLLPNVA